ncbi:MAG: hypothetical protein ACI8RW_000119 [Porticoccaceae bacterium]
MADIRRLLPGSPERQACNEIMDAFSQYARDDVSYREAVSDIERLLVLYKYQKNHDNARATAEQASLVTLFNL